MVATIPTLAAWPEAAGEQLVFEDEAVNEGVLPRGHADSPHDIGAALAGWYGRLDG